MSVKKFGIAVHGGAGVLRRSRISDEQEKNYHISLEEAISLAYELLEQKGSALDAVAIAVKTLENNPVFNAGRGAVFNHDGRQEMDAAIMDGKKLMAGTVCAVHNIVNPVLLAREIMEHSEHVMMCGEGAEQFAREHSIEFAPDEYFFTEHRHEQLVRAREKKLMQLDDGSLKKFGTVGAVALDTDGNLAAATSTGGITNKRFGRIGDTPIIGAGTYANNRTCAISCTGHGEYFIRAVVAYDIHALMEYKGLLLSEACDLVVNKKLKEIGGEGGLIAIDRFCNVHMPFNSEGMYRGYRTINSSPVTLIYKKD